GPDEPGFSAHRPPLSESSTANRAPRPRARQRLGRSDRWSSPSASEVSLARGPPRRDRATTPAPTAPPVPPPTHQSENVRPSCPPSMALDQPRLSCVGVLCESCLDAADFVVSLAPVAVEDQPHQPDAEPGRDDRSQRQGDRADPVEAEAVEIIERPQGEI